MIPAERPIEALARTVACPVCGAAPGKRCNYGQSWESGSTTAYSHTGRRLKAEARK
jgi:hypothetical protein